jgi:hypothetical protein
MCLLGHDALWRSFSGISRSIRRYKELKAQRPLCRPRPRQKTLCKARLTLRQDGQSWRVQSVFLIRQGNVCPLEALQNLATVVPAMPDSPLFSWLDNKGEIRPMVKSKAVNRINSILRAWGWGTTFGHSFRIGGASFYLSQKVDPEIVRIAGRWRSLAYEAYIRAFEQVASRHMGNLMDNQHGQPPRLGLG